MMESPPVVTLHFPTAHMPAIITRLTTYLLQKSYGFVQTCYDAGGTDFDIFTLQNHPMVRLTLRAAESSGTPTSVSSRPLTADVVQLLQHLLQADMSM